ncbi:MAG: FtsX-like permease family protein [Myxococcota bacterium]
MRHSLRHQAGRFVRAAPNPLLPMRIWREGVERLLVNTRLVALLCALFFGACVLNFVGLLFARFRRLVPAVAVRRALGASRWDIVVQHVTECLMYSALANGVGVAITALVMLMLDNTILPLQGKFTLHAWVTGASCLWTTWVIVLGGLYPSWWLGHTPPATRLKGA